MWVRHVNPESTLGIPIMLDVLLMVIIGGIGTLYGGVIGAAFLLTARTLLPDLKAWTAVIAPGSRSASGSPSAGSCTGILFILVVFFFRSGSPGRSGAARPLPAVTAAARGACLRAPLTMVGPVVMV
jgi:branched-chain amino acid transport system permease protein